MSNILIFGGTTEGRLLANELSKLGHQVYLSVATTHGKAMITPQEGLHIVWGRKTPRQMQQLINEHNIHRVVDATHPFAKEVSEHIRQGVALAPRPLYRLLREEEKTKYKFTFNYPWQVVKHLAATQGNILLTTGSKTLEEYTKVDNYSQRIFVRVLPMASSIEKALSLAYHPSHIIALQGPFSKT